MQVKLKVSGPKFRKCLQERGPQGETLADVLSSGQRISFSDWDCGKKSTANLHAVATIPLPAGMQSSVQEAANRIASAVQDEAQRVLNDSFTRNHIGKVSMTFDILS